METGVFADGAQVRSSRWVLIQHDWCPCKMGTGGQRGRHAQREDEVKTAVRPQRETRVMRLRAKDTEDRREGKGGILLKSRQRKRVPRKPDSGLPTSRAERRYISAVSSHPGHRTWLQQPERATQSALRDSIQANLSSITGCHPPQVVLKLNFLEAPPPLDGTTSHHFVPLCSF